jgi:4-hydroxy-tetrahydrodipicolinate synthase
MKGGCIGAMVTSLKGNGELNEEGMRWLVNHFIKSGVHGLYPCGSQGEACLLSTEEKKKVIEWVVDEANGRVPVYAGTGEISTEKTLELTKYAKDAGADGAVVLTPFYVKPDVSELFDYYKTVAETVDMPIIIYNNPARSGGVNVTPDLLFKLTEFNNIVGIKDSAGDLVQMTEYINACGEKMAIVQGVDSLVYSALSLGADGAVSGPTFNIAPKIWIGIYESFIKGDLEKARQLQSSLFPVVKATCRPSTLGTYPSTVKEAMNMMGLPAGPAKKPLLPLTKVNKQELRRILSDLGLLK